MESIFLLSSFNWRRRPSVKVSSSFSIEITSLTSNSKAAKEPRKHLKSSTSMSLMAVHLPQVLMNSSYPKNNLKISHRNPSRLKQRTNNLTSSKKRRSLSQRRPKSKTRYKAKALLFLLPQKEE
jgi:hypothetical protein